LTGVFAEPAAAAAYAGLAKLVTQGQIDPEERIVLMITGSGLKDIASARKSAGEPYVVDANLSAVKKIAAGW
jgi:threonine synthase